MSGDREEIRGTKDQNTAEKKRCPASQTQAQNCKGRWTKGYERTRGEEQRAKEAEADGIKRELCILRMRRAPFVKAMMK